MEKLSYIVEDSTIAELLGVQNFTNKESAVLELVKNAYDAHANKVLIHFEKDTLFIWDDGIGMDKSTILENWMHVGKSDKGYVDSKSTDERVLAGSKGIGRFALARLGASVTLYSVKENSAPVKWVTNWNESILDDWDNEENMPVGTKIEIKLLRDNWTERQIISLIEYLSVTCLDSRMTIRVEPNFGRQVSQYYDSPQLGINCTSKINLTYDSVNQKLRYIFDSDEFLSDATKYCPEKNLTHYEGEISIADELMGDKSIDLSVVELKECLTSLGNFSSELYFSLKSSTLKDCESFLYKYTALPDRYNNGVVLYRNAFSISSFDGERDWLELGKRTRRSPAAASHETGSWRVRENQISGKVVIDKKENEHLRDLSNRQGLEENAYYKLFVRIIIIGISAFERYRQSIIRLIDKKNKLPEPPKTTLIDEILKNPNKATFLSAEDAKNLVLELDTVKTETKTYQQEKKTTEEKYRYDVRILNVLATTGLKAASIAHEMKNDRNSVSVNYDYIVSALSEYGFWEELNLPEYTEFSYKNVPQLLSRNKEINKKLVTFMDTMLDEIEQKKFSSRNLNISDVMGSIRSNWSRDYASLKIHLDINEDLRFDTSEDVFTAIFDNLLLNSWQQNKHASVINIIISIFQRNQRLIISYSDDGVGLPPKYINDPMRILAVHETSRENGHGLGMWIVNNTIVMTGGEVNTIDGHNGFKISFELGDKL
ncbi:MAG TPA: ATP-binding protein [Firmicutes bacterium]|nr:ATP-binding protein [Bacillota bacterium]